MDNAASSYGYYKTEVRNWIISRLPENASILDVGAGCGTYYHLLRDKYKNIDAVEIYKPNIIDWNLLECYRSVSCRSIVGLEYPAYDMIIFGDVIEHLSIEEARRVLEYAYNKCTDFIVAVPFELEQEGNENEHERHIQGDLTQENVLERYPMLKLLIANDKYGYYRKNDKWRGKWDDNNKVEE